MNTQDLARAVASAKEMLDAHGWVGSERRVQVAKALLAVAADIDALHSRHAAMVGELKKLPRYEASPEDGWTDFEVAADGSLIFYENLQAILSQHEGKEEGRG